MLELTDEERANGWDEQSLAAYIKQREKAQAGIVMFNPDYRRQPKPRWANSLYDPMKFGR